MVGYRMYMNKVQRSARNLRNKLFIYLFYLILQDIRNYSSIKNNDKSTRHISLVFTGYKYKTTNVKPYNKINKDESIYTK